MLSVVSLQMLSKRSLSVIVLVSCVHLIYGQLPDISRSYDTEVTHLDFVYHNHEEMTNYLRSVDWQVFIRKMALIEFVLL